MDHYVDIDVRPDPEFPAHQLMSARCTPSCIVRLWRKLARALA